MNFSKTNKVIIEEFQEL